METKHSRFLIKTIRSEFSRERTQVLATFSKSIRASYFHARVSRPSLLGEEFEVKRASLIRNLNLSKAASFRHPFALLLRGKVDVSINSWKFLGIFLNSVSCFRNAVPIKLFLIFALPRRTNTFFLVVKKEKKKKLNRVLFSILENF